MKVAPEKKPVLKLVEEEQTMKGNVSTREGKTLNANTVHVSTVDIQTTDISIVHWETFL